MRMFSSLVATFVLVFAVGCGRRDNGNRRAGGAAELAECGETCAETAECATGQCIGGVCDCDGGGNPQGTGTSCGDSGDCGTNEYCHYSSDWVSGAPGVCDSPCNGNCPLSAGYFQTCHEGVCYTERDCTPGSATPQCPPGEVCNSQTHSCTSPPGTCYFNEDCPDDWVCNTDNTCIDPGNVNLGGCTSSADCNNAVGCSNGSCDCNNGACQPRGGCDDAGDCGAGNNCEAGVCRPAVSCATGGQNACTPYGRVCENGYCVEADPCTNGTCPAGQTCNTSTNPPKCFPSGTNECVRDDQCGAGEYCELFNGTCNPGCRSSADCADGQNCGSSHTCSTGGGGIPGSTCSRNEDCSGGTVCAYDDPTMAAFCPLMPMPECTQSCRVVCDILVSQIAETCPSGTTCGGDSDIMTQAIMTLLQSMMGGTSSSVSACY